MKKIVIMALSLLVMTMGMALLAGCGGSEKTDVVMIISEKGNFENNAFNTSTMDGIKEYCKEADLNSTYLEPEEPTMSEYEKCVEQAVEMKAEVIVLPGYLLEGIAMQAQNDYPDISFIVIDGVPNNGGEGDDYEEEIGDNTYSVMYAEEQAGYLAGYAAVKNGYKKLGFFGGMSVPAVVRFGYGYIQGAEYAAQEMKLKEDEVELRYLYCGSFSPSPEFQSKASSWYFDKTEVIFACGGGIGASVMKAAEAEEKYVIGVDIDQSTESSSVVTSAMKLIEKSVYDAVKSHFEGDFPGGTSVRLGTKEEGVGLAMETSKLKKFSEEEYQGIYSQLSNNEGKLASSIIKDPEVEIKDIPTKKVKVIMDSFN